jgi:hypothetical protein
MPRFGDMNPRSFGPKVSYALDSTCMPRFGDMNPRSFCAKLIYVSASTGMPRFGDMNPRSFGAKLNYASASTGMPRFGDMNPRSFGAKRKKITTFKIQPLAATLTLYLFSTEFYTYQHYAFHVSVITDSIVFSEWPWYFQMESSSVSSSLTAYCFLDSSYSFVSFQGAQPSAPFCIAAWSH